jgi:hypothetical protein
MFASLTQATIPVPFDPPHTVTVRKLTGREIDTAQAAHAMGISGGGASHWATKFRRLLEGSISDKAQIEQAIADPLTGYDRYALVRAGLVAWSYPQAITPVAAKAAVKNKDGTIATPAVEASDAIEDLDDEAVDFIATEVLRLTKPRLFDATEEDVSTAQKEIEAAAPIA